MQSCIYAMTHLCNDALLKKFCRIVKIFKALSWYKMAAPFNCLFGRWDGRWERLFFGFLKEEALFGWLNYMYSFSFDSLLVIHFTFNFRTWRASHLHLDRVILLVWPLFTHTHGRRCWIMSHTGFVYIWIHILVFVTYHEDAHGALSGITEVCGTFICHDSLSHIQIIEKSLPWLM